MNIKDLVITVLFIIVLIEAVCFQGKAHDNMILNTLVNTQKGIIKADIDNMNQTLTFFSNNCIK